MVQLALDLYKITLTTSLQLKNPVIQDVLKCNKSEKNLIKEALGFF